MEQNETGALIELKVLRIVPDPNTETQIVILQNDRRSDMLPIWVGMAEGNAIRLALEGVVTPRPMSHDLMKSFIDYLSVRVQRVVVTDVKDRTYFATIHLVSKGVERTLDARPSDAIALALRTHSPIYVTEDVLRRRSGGNLDAWLAKFETKNFGSQDT